MNWNWNWFIEIFFTSFWWVIGALQQELISIYFGQFKTKLTYLNVTNLYTFPCKINTKFIQVSIKILNDFFLLQFDRLPFEEFSKWLLRNPDVTTLTRWLLIVSNGCSIQLTDSSETPTFYQTLASVTHCKFYSLIQWGFLVNNSDLFGWCIGVLWEVFASCEWLGELSMKSWSYSPHPRDVQ